MAETDLTTEARRKALRNGEEDPVVVAQRFLNIYRQMHIFSPERKEAFDKMLLDLSPVVRTILGSLPGGAMLQDYIDEVLQKHGMSKIDRSNIDQQDFSDLEEDTKKIDDQKLASSEPPVTSVKPGVQVNSIPSVTIPSKISLDENFAKDLAAAFANIQPLSQPQLQANLDGAPATLTSKIELGENFASEISKIMSVVIEKQNKTQQENLEKIVSDINKTQLYLAKNIKDTQEEQKQTVNKLIESISENHRQEREDQRKGISEICSVLTKGQTALSLSMGNKVQTSITDDVASEISETKQMMELLTESQKQLNTRLEKIETNSKGGFVAEPTDNGSILRAIETSQEKLIQTLNSINLQNNTSQATNNANNIQINTPDNSSQIMMILDKMFSMQASNQKSIENAITEAIKAQGEIYDKIADRQTEKLATILAENLKGITPVYVPHGSIQYPIEKETVLSAEDEDNIKEISEKIKTDYVIEEDNKTLERENFSLENDESVSSKKKKKKKKKKNKTIEDNQIEDIPVVKQEESIEDILFDSNNGFSEDNFIKEENKEEDHPVSTEDELINTETIFADGTDEDLKVFEEEKEDKIKEKAEEKWTFSEDEVVSEKAEEGAYTELSEINLSDDWGFGSHLENDEEKETKIADNEENKTIPLVETIGSTSYIASGDLYNFSPEGYIPAPILTSEKMINLNNIPVIYDDCNDTLEDPYQNSILKD